jgi:protein-S-isoprenylcysteine O-methyltransferase Ste14
MYSGALMLLIFTPAALGSCWGMIPVAVLTAAIVVRALDEEQELKQNLAGYETYCNTVKYRFVPYIF